MGGAACRAPRVEGGGRKSSKADDEAGTTAAGGYMGYGGRSGRGVSMRRDDVDV